MQAGLLHPEINVILTSCCMVAIQAEYALVCSSSDAGVKLWMTTWSLFHPLFGEKWACSLLTCLQHPNLFGTMERGWCSIHPFLLPLCEGKKQPHILYRKWRYRQAPQRHAWAPSAFLAPWACPSVLSTPSNRAHSELLLKASWVRETAVQTVFP